MRKFLSGEDLDDIQSMMSKDATKSKNGVDRFDSHEILSIRNGTFTWDSEMDPVLKQINMDAPKGKLIAVVGQMGAGKSSLLSALLGETKKLSGKIKISGNVAYVPQQAWIQNKSFRQNILFDKKLHRSRYNKVVKVFLCLFLVYQNIHK